MSSNKVSDEVFAEAVRLVEQYGSTGKAAKATGISRTTLNSRLEIAQVRANRPKSEPTIVPLALPDAPVIREIVARSNNKHMVVPDTQCRPGVPLDHMRWAGLYAAVKKPDKIIHIGDNWDMASLSSYDKGKRSFEGRRYDLDIKAGNLGIELFMEPIYDEMEACAKRGEVWDPELHFAVGNHEERILRAINDQPELDGVIGYKDFNLTNHGWVVHPYLEVFQVDGVNYAHFFTSGVMGRPVASARALLTKKHSTCVMGHVQKYEVAIDYDARGRRLTGLFAGCFYQHDEPYLGAQTNRDTWRGVHILYGCEGGEFTHNSVDLGYLKDRFEGK